MRMIIDRNHPIELQRKHTSNEYVLDHQALSGRFSPFMTLVGKFETRVSSWNHEDYED
jgi:hypothetical protein